MYQVAYRSIDTISGYMNWKRDYSLLNCPSDEQGNYPYPSTYILNGAGMLPAFPMRIACDFMAEENPKELELLSGLAQAAGVFYNYTGDLPCFNYTCVSGPVFFEGCILQSSTFCETTACPAPT